MLEYCVEEWRSKYNRTEWSVERVGTCSGGGGHNLDTLVSLFSSGTQFVTEQSGSTNTFVFEKASGLKFFTASITAADLVNAINRDRQPENESGVNGSNSGGCSRSLSTNPQNYALIGVEQGVEGWHKLSALGGSSANLQLHTTYQPLPPEASTSAASSVEEEQATLNGTVNPRGTDTHYYFQYGATTAYGSSTSEGNAGSSTSSVPESAAVTGLQAGTTYHYRIVANNTGGTSYGADQTFSTPEYETSSRWAIRDAISGNQWLDYPGATERVCEWHWTSAGWGNDCHSGEDAATGTSPTVVRDPSSGNQWIYYTGTSGRVCEWHWTSAGWGNNCLSGENVAAGTSPTVVRDPSSGNQWIYYVGTTNRICEWHWTSAGWGNN